MNYMLQLESVYIETTVNNSGRDASGIDSDVSLAHLNCLEKGHQRLSTLAQLILQPSHCEGLVILELLEGLHVSQTGAVLECILEAGLEASEALLGST